MADVRTLPLGAARSPKDTTRYPGRYRGLLVFWGVVGGVLAATAVTLQVLGPPPAKVDFAALMAPPKPAVPPKKLPVIPPPDPALLEPAADFQGHNLPIRAPDGRTPMAVYAAPFDATDKHPRVALVVDGAGMNQEQTLHLLQDLPGAVDVAFSAYTDDDQVDKLAALARKTGHECLVSIPMEPNNFPLADEGQHQLQEVHDAEANRLDLEWALSRQTGCVGATGASDGMAGERFAQDGLGFSQVLEEVGKRGLLYLDPRTGSPALTSAPETSISVVDMVIDPLPTSADAPPLTADSIDQRLAALEKLATVHGSAIGLAGPPQPVMLERIAVWAHGLAARGVTLAPLTAVQPAPKPADQDGN
jgi:polysaccharide deacetylase 2 family uncharacterized protein YibQ